jgi:hypothetical protein
MKTVLLSFPIEKQRLIEILDEDIEVIVSERVAARRKARLEVLRRSRTKMASLDQAIQNVARASARVDAAHNTRDERASISSLIAAASGLRRAVEASKKGL